MKLNRLCSAEPQQQAIPTDNKGNLLYHEVPVERTIEDLYDGSLDDTEIADVYFCKYRRQHKKEYNSVERKHRRLAQTNLNTCKKNKPIKKKLAKQKQR